MNIYDFIQHPDNGETYARNEVPPFEIATASVILATLEVDGTVVFSGSYMPDFYGKVVIDFAGLYDSFLKTFLPKTGIREINQTEYRKLFTATFGVVAGELTSEEPFSMSWYVANADMRPPEGFADWSETAFLTGQPAEKLTCFDTPEWLTWLDLDGGTCLKVRFYRKSDGSAFSDAVVSPSLPSPGCRSAEVTYSRLVRLALIVNPSNLAPYYDLILFSSGGEELTRQRYIYTDRTGQEKYYCFVNRLGGVDTLICRGENTLQPDVTHNIGRFQRTGGAEYSAMDDTNDTQVWQQQTGMVPYRWRDWVSELLAAKQGAAAYDTSDKAYREIVVKSSKLEMGDARQLASASFSYIMSDAGYTPSAAGQKSPGDLHQSSADSGGEPLDETVERSLPLNNGTTEAVVVPSERIVLNLEDFAPGTVVTWLVNGVVGGTVTVGSDASKEVLTIPYGASVSFAVEGTSGACVEMTYYEGLHSDSFYRAAWSGPVCVQVKERYTFAWSSPVCVQVEAPYTFGWSEAVCVETPETPSYSFGWSEAVCVQQYSYELTWEDF